MIKLVVTDAVGERHVVTATEGQSLMEALRLAGLPIHAACGGSLACATCHVIVAEEDFSRIGPPSEDEEDMLDQGFQVTRTSRLSCQIIVTSKVDSLALTLPGAGGYAPR